ncbi:hypothetical protein Hanom_Chr02g00133291 [Helianthus anomalus]
MEKYNLPTLSRFLSTIQQEVQFSNIIPSTLPHPPLEFLFRPTHRPVPAMISNNHTRTHTPSFHSQVQPTTPSFRAARWTPTTTAGWW